MRGKVRNTKKIMVLAFLGVFLLTSCATVTTTTSSLDKEITSVNTTITTTTATTTATTMSITTSALPAYVPGSIEVFPAQDLQDAWDLPYLPTKRSIYYQTFGYISEIVGYDKADEFWRDYDASKVDRNSESSQMIMKLFVEYFDISKEDFIAAVEKKRKRLLEQGDEVDTNEENELPNADIIYTFDNEIIDYYYRRE